MNTQEYCDYTDKLEAARAMLAALQTLQRRMVDLKPMTMGDLQTVSAAIKQAEAAGIKVAS